uniref:Uncharacterized protein n=1 Tax=Candidatus Kentrum sp. DK TaxID=2126562 RepID=A0A450S846_9GAMM|nr:MAG: hypothetical protein BECKDK2373B_GA0170837_100165 [Candidatus Kentron sp. DK]VFJ48090.1 MAG: hypothetical protein BECKDK2373C_GA0170839_10205 [Candidatus Kentron sp. DK]
MSELDNIKETIGYLKFWLGVVVFSGVSLTGWLMANADTASGFKLSGAVIIIGTMVVLAIVLHKHIAHLILTLKEP